MPWRAQSLKGTTNAAFVFAFQNSIGQLGGVIGALRSPVLAGSSIVLTLTLSSHPPGPQIFRAKYAPRYTVPYIVCLVFLVLSLLATLWTWWLTAPLEKETRRIAKIRNAAGKGQNVLVADEIDPEFVARQK